MKPGGETRIRDAFRALRESEASHTPSTDRVLSRAPSRRRLRIGRVVGVVATAAVGSALFVAVSEREPDEVMIAEWRAPSDALLTLARPIGFEEIRHMGTASLGVLTSTSKQGNAK